MPSKVSRIAVLIHRPMHMIEKGEKEVHLVMHRAGGWDPKRDYHVLFDEKKMFDLDCFVR